MQRPLPTSHQQRGSMLLEALIAIVIFSIGILAIVGLQANSIKMASDAKFRSDASLLANQYITSMWADMGAAVTAASGGTPTVFSATEFASYNTGGTNFNNWYNNTVLPALPNASAVVTTNTTILCGNAACPGSPSGMQQNSTTTTTVTINWKLPGGDTHTYSTVTLISAQKQI